MQTKKITNIEEMNLLSSQWESLFSAGKLSPMQGHDWLISCAEVLSDRELCSISVMDENGGLLAFAPLDHEKSLTSSMELLGIRIHKEPCDFVYANKGALNELTRKLAECKRPLELRRIRADSPTIPAIKNAYLNKGVVIVRDSSSYPYIELDSSIGDAEQLLSSRLRSDLRRAMRKAKAMGEVSFDVHSPSKMEFLSMYNEAMNIEASGWKGRAVTSLLDDSFRQKFFRVYGLRGAEKGLIKLAFMKINSKPVAMQIAVQQGKKYWLLKIGYNEKFSKCSPGMLLMLHTLRYAKEQKLDTYEFLGTSEEWTNRWTTHHRLIARVNVYPYSFSGVLGLLGRAGYAIWSRISSNFRSRQCRSC